MRKQYYFRPSDHGLLSWDVDRLVRLTSHLPLILSAGGAVMDGMHRVAKAVLQGRDAIDAVQFEEDPEPDHDGLGPEESPY